MILVRLDKNALIDIDQIESVRSLTLDEENWQTVVTMRSGDYFPISLNLDEAHFIISKRRRGE